VAVVTDRGAAPTYAVGETVNFVATVSSDAYVYCYYRQATGEVFRLFPNSHAADPRVKAGEAVQIPGAAPFQIRFDVPNSTEGVGCVAVADDLAIIDPTLAAAPDLTPLPYPTIEALAGSVRERAGGRAASSIIEIKVKR
jgi:hypothetical protein